MRRGASRCARIALLFVTLRIWRMARSLSLRLGLETALSRLRFLALASLQAPLCAYPPRFSLVALAGVEPTSPGYGPGVLPLHDSAIWRRAEVPTPNLSINRISNPFRPPGRFALRMAPAEGLEPSCPKGRRFSGPVRYQFRCKLAYEYHGCASPRSVETSALVISVVLDH